MSAGDRFLLVVLALVLLSVLLWTLGEIRLNRMRRRVRRSHPTRRRIGAHRTRKD